jgi:hypothetical protein
VADETIVRENDDEVPAAVAVCNATGPYRGRHRCTEPVGHDGNHKHDQDGGCCEWAAEG